VGELQLKAFIRISEKNFQKMIFIFQTIFDIAKKERYIEDKNPM